MDSVDADHNVEGVWCQVFVGPLVEWSRGVHKHGGQNATAGTVRHVVPDAETKMHEWCFRPLFCTARLYWAGDNLSWMLEQEGK